MAILASQTWMGFKERWISLDNKQRNIRLVISFLLVGLVIFNFTFEIMNDLDKLTELFGPEGNKSFFGY
jgi:hypothetical protein